MILLLILCLLTSPSNAEMHEIKVSPVQRCGPHCVIETEGFDSHEEALEFALHAGSHTLYQVRGTKLWFVDYEVIEDDVI